MISVDSQERTLNALPDFDSEAQGASWEACASLEDGTPVGEPPLIDKVANEASPTDEADGPPPRSRRPSLALFGA